MDFAEVVYNMSGKVDEIVQFIYREVNSESYDYVIYDHHFLAGKIIAEMLEPAKRFVMHDICNGRAVFKNVYPARRP